MRRQGRLPEWVLALSVLCGTLLAALAIGEMACRVAGYGDAVQYRYVPELGWVHRPNQVARTIGKIVHINANGIRGPDSPLAKPSGTLRILLLGDSFTFGYGVDDDSTYGRQLERMFAERDTACSKVEVLNAGVNGYNTDQELAFLRRSGLAFGPDVVLLGFTPNDIMRADQAKMMLRWPRLKEFFSKSALYQFFAPRVKAVIFHQAALAYEDTLSQFMRGDTAVASFGTDLRKSLAEFHSLSETAKFRLIVVIFPFATQVYPRQTATWPPQALTLAGTESGMALVDLLPAFDSAARRGEDLFLDEPTHHPNGHGQKIVADEVYAALRRTGLPVGCARRDLPPLPDSGRVGRHLQ